MATGSNSGDDQGCVGALVIAFLISCAVLGFKLGTAIHEGKVIKIEVAPGGR